MLVTAFQDSLLQQDSWPGFQQKDQVQGQLMSVESQALFFNGWLVDFFFLSFQSPPLLWDGREKQLGVAESSLSSEVNSPSRDQYSPWQNNQMGTICSFNLSLAFLLFGAQVVLPSASPLPYSRCCSTP